MRLFERAGALVEGRGGGGRCETRRGMRDGIERGGSALRVVMLGNIMKKV